MESQSGQARMAEIWLSLDYVHGLVGTSRAFPGGKLHYFENNFRSRAQRLSPHLVPSLLEQRLWGLLRDIIFMLAWCASANIGSTSKTTWQSPHPRAGKRVTLSHPPRTAPPQPEVPFRK